MLFQVISRNNDVNGNPYRLVLVYDSNGIVQEVYEARSSSPNICHKLRKQGYVQLIGFHVQPAEYNQVKKDYKEKLQHVD